ncbi:hypothetical protein FHL15_009238 [Xylaria flabelliformis]|uniref:Uncharacterized protein n=1 Tax=Xylaria flabelliformis TaxID=2512241 RepID=A0A553HPC2_9PEZI|nr:hypothetical protein FHL15_009238 [Xylaria flabelliformis]
MSTESANVFYFRLRWYDSSENDAGSVKIWTCHPVTLKVRQASPLARPYRIRSNLSRSNFKQSSSTELESSIAKPPLPPSPRPTDATAYQCRSPVTIRFDWSDNLTTAFCIPTRTFALPPAALSRPLVLRLSSREEPTVHTSSRPPGAFTTSNPAASKHRPVHPLLTAWSTPRAPSA